MKRFGLIGHPIAHSLSPALFKAGYDGKYPYELIETADFEEAYSRFLEKYDGINVTAPFKELAFAKADLLSDECRLVGATNLLIKTPEGVKAYNSDFLGVRMWIEEALSISESDRRVTKRTPPTSWAPPPAASGVARFSFTLRSDSGPRIAKVLIAGCGGAGKAAAAAAATLGLKVVVMNRSQDKAERLARDLTAGGYDVEAASMDEFCRHFNEADIVIYNIPTAIPGINDLTDSDFASGKPKVILEANYKNPSFDEAFIRRIQQINPESRFTGGRTWLLYQALTGYEIFTGEKPDLQRMSDVL